MPLEKPKQKKAPNTELDKYIIQHKDSLWKIVARRYRDFFKKHPDLKWRVIDAIQKLNNFSDADLKKLKPGQKINLYKKKALEELFFPKTDTKEKLRKLREKINAPQQKKLKPDKQKKHKQKPVPRRPDPNNVESKRMYAYNNEKLEKLQKNFKEKVKQLLEKAGEAGLNVGISEGFRSIEKQNTLHKKSRKVTNMRGGYSWHNYGLAVDIVFLNKEGKIDKSSWAESNNWAKLGEIGESLGLKWGGRWKRLVDRPHFEYHPGYNKISRWIADGKPDFKTEKPKS